MSHNHSQHNHSHSHHHHHIDPTEISPASFRFVAAMNFIITIAEFIGGFMSGSLALVSDAVHNLSDTVSIVLSYYAYKISKKGNDRKRTFGYKRAEVIAAFINSTSLIIISAYLIYEAIKRFKNPEHIDGKLMLIVAVIGLIANLISMFIYKKLKTQYEYQVRIPSCVGRYYLFCRGYSRRSSYYKMGCILD